MRLRLLLLLLLSESGIGVHRNVSCRERPDEVFLVSGLAILDSSPLAIPSVAMAVNHELRRVFGNRVIFDFAGERVDFA